MSDVVGQLTTQSVPLAADEASRSKVRSITSRTRNRTRKAGKAPPPPGGRGPGGPPFHPPQSLVHELDALLARVIHRLQFYPEEYRDKRNHLRVRDRPLEMDASKAHAINACARTRIDLYSQYEVAETQAAQNATITELRATVEVLKKKVSGGEG